MPDDGKLGKFKNVGKIASQVVAHIGATFSSGTKISREKLGEKKKVAVVNCFRQLCFEDNEFSGEAVVFSRDTTYSAADNLGSGREGQWLTYTCCCPLN